MIVTAALPWWNERPEDLDRCVRAVGVVADRIVALDGSYRRYPGATGTSPSDQADAIRDAAVAMGIEYEIHQPDFIFAGQVEKRTLLLGLAAINSDWIATIDADHVVHCHAKHVRQELERTSADVLAVVYTTPPNPDRSETDSAAGVWHLEQVNATPRLPHFWRPLPGLRVEKRHWWYSAIKDGQRVWLWATEEDETYPHQPWGEMGAPYTVEHLCLYRTEEQIRASRAFLNDRERVVELTGQEDDVPGLPKPRYDYDRLPA